MNIKVNTLAILLLISFFFAVHVYGADATNMLLEKADKAYQNERYGGAAVLYRVVFERLEKQSTASPDVVAYVRYRLGHVPFLAKGRTVEALAQMKEFYEKHSDRLVIVRSYAGDLFRFKQYREAVPVFEKAAVLDKSFAPKSYYYVGMSKFLSGKYSDALDDLIKARDTVPDSIEGKNAAQFLANLEKTILEQSGMEKQAAVTTVPGLPTKEKPWAVSLSLGLEYDSNVGLIPSEQTRPSDISSEGDWRAVHSLNGVYEFLNTGKHFAGVNVGTYGTTQFRDNMFNVENGVLSVYYKTNFSDTLQFRLSTFASKTWLDAASHNWSWGVTPGISYQPVSWTWTDLNYTFAKTDFTDAPQYAEENRSGKNQTTILKQNFVFPSLLLNKKITYFGTWFFYGKSDTEGASYVNYSRGLGVQAQQELPRDFTFLMTYSYGKTSYENGNIRSPSNEKRDDGSHTLSANLFKRLPEIYRNLSAYAGWRWYKNNSNIENYYSYSSNTYSIGLVVDF